LRFLLSESKGRRSLSLFKKPLRILMKIRGKIKERDRPPHESGERGKVPRSSPRLLERFLI
jgi:hypothetical protein